MRASNHIPVAKICARIENINEVWLYDTLGLRIARIPVGKEIVKIVSEK